MSESEMEEVRLNGRTPYSGYARYIRLRNAGSTVVAFHDTQIPGLLSLGKLPILPHIVGITGYIQPKLTQGLTRLDIPEEYENVFEIKLSWGNVTHTFYEFITIPREKAFHQTGSCSPIRCNC